MSMENLDIIKLPKSKEVAKQIAVFIKENEYLLPDPFSNHVDVEQYSQKLNSLGEGWGVIKNEKLVAFCGGYINDFITRKAYLQLLLVSEKYQGLGLGSSLITAFYEYAKKMNFKQIQLTVDTENEKALYLYHKKDFIESTKKNPNNKKIYMIKSINNFDIKKVQNKLLDMGKEIARILEKNDIPYMIVFGTLLGAVRHGGFIPWDDDFDMLLFDDTYNKAIEILRKELPNDMFVEDNNSEPLYFHGWAHVKDLNSKTVCSAYPQDSIYRHKGLSIDLYKAKKIKECELDDYVAEEYIRYLLRKQKIGLISAENAQEKINKINEKRYSYGTKQDDKIVLGLNLAERRMEFHDVFPLKKYSFENTEFFGPNNPSNLLFHFYGADYMTLPPIENRLSHYDSVIFIKN